MHEKGLSDKALRAAKKGLLSTLQDLNLKSYDLEDLADDKGATVVHYGARSGSVDVLDYLINQCGFDGRKKSHVGATPAHDAAATGNLETLIWLLGNTHCDSEDEDESGAAVSHLSAR